jgi:hypothetical protein
VSNPLDLDSTKSSGVTSSGPVSYPPLGNPVYSKANTGSVNPEIRPVLLIDNPGGNSPALGVR